jgi:hypothetical protein
MVALVQRAGIDCEMTKCDVKRALRLLPIHPDDYNLVGFTFNKQFYFDKAMAMDCSMACSIWVKFSTFIEWLVYKEAKKGLVIGTI